MVCCETINSVTLGLFLGKRGKLFALRGGLGHEKILGTRLLFCFCEAGSAWSGQLRKELGF